MQDCFRQYPEIYGAELAEDEQDGEAGPDDQQHPGPVEGVPEGAAASEPADEALSGKATTPTKALESAKNDNAASTHEAHQPASERSTPLAAASTTATPKPPAEAAKDDVVQAEVNPFDTPLEENSGHNVDDSHVPKAAFDATGANKSTKN